MNSSNKNNLNNNFTVDNTLNKLKCDIYEKNDMYNIDVDIPGFEKKNISIEIRKGNLTVIAEKSDDNDSNTNYIRRERIRDKCQISFNIGTLDANQIGAKYKNGVLKILIPKKENTEDKKIVSIK